MAEFAQLENLDVYEALDPSKLTNAQKKAALRAINLFKERGTESSRGVHVPMDDRNATCMTNRKPHLQLYPPMHSCSQ
jgi:hypothetical protein